MQAASLETGSRQGDREILARQYENWFAGCLENSRPVSTLRHCVSGVILFVDTSPRCALLTIVGMSLPQCPCKVERMELQTKGRNPHTPPSGSRGVAGPVRSTCGLCSMQ